MKPELLKKYLNLLGITPKSPTMDELQEVTRAFFARVPFENISKLYYLKKHGLRNTPEIEQYLDGIERYNFGGTCFSNNYYLYLLLKNLDYDVMLCGCDMTNPDVHLAIVVDIDRHQYLVDAGYAAPFTAPLPLDLKEDYEILSGYDRYVLKPKNTEGRSILELYRNGELKHGYSIKPRPRDITEFNETIVDSFREKATFLNSILMAKFLPGKSTVIHNLSIIESTGTDVEISKLANRDELAEAIYIHFRIPLEISREVIYDLGNLEDAWN